MKFWMWVQATLHLCSHEESLQIPKGQDPSTDPLLPFTRSVSYLNSWCLESEFIWVHCIRQVVIALGRCFTKVPGNDCWGGLPHEKLSQFKHPKSWGRYWTDDACTPLILVWFSFLDLAASCHCVTSRNRVKDSSTELMERSCRSTTSRIYVFFCLYIAIDRE